MTGAADIPTSFGFPVFLRIIFPGIAGSVLLTYTFVSLFISDWGKWGLDTKLIFLIFTGIVLGIILQAIEFYIYQFYEGLRFWPKSLLKIINRRTWDEYRTVVTRYYILYKKYLFSWDKIPGDDEIVLLNYLKGFNIECLSTAKFEKINKGRAIRISTKNGSILLKLNDEETEVILEIYDGRIYPLIVEIENNNRNVYYKIYSKDLDFFDKIKESKILYKLYEYPICPKEGYLFDRHPTSPTRLGNVMAEYESYSENRYGMHMLVYWHQLWFLAPDEVRNFLDLTGATADFLLYMSFLFLIFSPLFSIGIVYQNYAKFLTFHMPYIALISIGVFILVILASLIISYILYCFAIQALKIYGKNVKAFFDIYRFDLADKLGVEIKLAPNELDKDQWEHLCEFLLDDELDDKKPLPPEKTTQVVPGQFQFSRK